MEAGFNYTRADIEEAINLSIAPSDDSVDDLLDGQHCGIGSGGSLPLEKKSRVRVSRAVFVRNKASDVSMSKCSEKTFTKTSDT